MPKGIYKRKPKKRHYKRKITQDVVDTLATDNRTFIQRIDDCINLANTVVSELGNVRKALG